MAATGDRDGVVDVVNVEEAAALRVAPCVAAGVTVCVAAGLTVDDAVVVTAGEPVLDDDGALVDVNDGRVLCVGEVEGGAEADELPLDELDELDVAVAVEDTLLVDDDAADGDADPVAVLDRTDV